MTEPAQRVSSVPDVAISLIRTWVPMGVGALLAWVAQANGIVVPGDASTTVGIVAASSVAALYYGLARAFEALRGTGLIARAGRALGRVMLGGLVSTPRYLTAAELAKLGGAHREPLV